MQAILSPRRTGRERVDRVPSLTLSYSRLFLVAIRDTILPASQPFLLAPINSLSTLDPARRTIDSIHTRLDRGVTSGFLNLYLFNYDPLDPQTLEVHPSATP